MWGPCCALILCIFYTVNSHSYKEHYRYKRQFGDFTGNESGNELQLNSSVPYIFSARLYPYGDTRGDLRTSGPVEPYRLENPIHYLGQIYDTIYIDDAGAVSFSSSRLRPAALPVSEPLIAVFWQKTRGATVYYRETTDESVVNLAHNEVNIQYRYGSRFHVKSVVLITWEGGHSTEKKENSEGNVFQLCLIIGDTMTFAHFVYSKLSSSADATAGFSSLETHYALPDSSTMEVFLLAEKSDIGIPGEWLFQIDGPQIFLCGAGFKGLECIETCSNSQWSNDCFHSCHCDGGDPCDHETGRCPNAKCSPGWRGEPICDKDIDECALVTADCPDESPDCLNTPGSYLCLCFEYDEENKRCKGAPAPKLSEQIEVKQITMSPSLTRATSERATVARNRFSSTEKSTTTVSTTKTMTTTWRTTTTKPARETADVTQTEKEATDVFVPTLSHIDDNETKKCRDCSLDASCVDGECVCRPGYDGDGKQCADTDECRSNPCGVHAVCDNLPGSYECVCENGYTMSADQCVDVDECGLEEVCGGVRDGVRCRNLEGSYACECKDGYHGDPNDPEIGCHDVDECAEANACGNNATCTNTIGGFECECQEGFERLSTTEGCTDMDECSVRPCHEAAVCTNLPGTFDCQCIDGFIGDGIQCHETILYPISNDSVVLPRDADAIATIKLPYPITVFGIQYEAVYVSSNGVVSFSRPFKGLVADAEDLTEPVIFALHAQFDYANQGLVAYTYINESDTAAQSLLMRSSIAAQTQFRFRDHRSRRLHIFTFDRMLQTGSSNSDSFQVVLADSGDSTILSLIYDTVESRGHISGLATPSGFVSLPNDLLTSRSNVAHPGKWMFRLDEPALVSCPAGTAGEPFCEKDCESGRWGFSCGGSCHCAGGLPCDLVTGTCLSGKCEPGWQGPGCDQDVDECANGLLKCTVNAECVNERGGAKCVCAKGFMGDGKLCLPVSRCFSRFQKLCSNSATCEEKPEGPICVCQSGFAGNGFECRQVLPVANTNDVLQTKLHEQALPLPDDNSEEHPFLMTKWSNPSTPPSVTPRPRPRVPPLNNNTPQKPITVETATTSTNDSEQSSQMSLLFLTVPGALCIVWIILLLVLVTVFFKKRKITQQPQRPAQFDGVWKSRRTDDSRRVCDDSRRSGDASRAPVHHATTRHALIAHAQMALPPATGGSGGSRSYSNYGPRIRPFEGY